MLISEITHPDYTLKLEDWNKWRLTYASGKIFINTYLKRLSSRETVEDFDERRAMSYCPAFAKTGVNEVKDSIYQRMIDITRAGGSKSYEEAVKGLNGGVDLLGSSMNYFMGCQILPELLTMERVGIYVDMPPLEGESLAANRNLRPYIYMYKAEDIRAWIVDDSSDPSEFVAILLQEYVYNYDPETGFPTGFKTRFRRVWRAENGLIYVAFYDNSGKMVDVDDNEISQPIQLNIQRVPFVSLKISESLLTDTADYQIALLNLASTDMAYALKANFPFYVEQQDLRAQSAHLRPPGSEDSDDANKGRTREIITGVSKGRFYALDQPAFIHPSPEPLMASMQKQEQLKAEIRLLMKLTIANLQGPKMASAESKRQDTQSLETGLSYIGLELENAERKIADLWAEYEGNTSVATVIYPETYSLRTDEDRQNEADRLINLLSKIPSKTYQKAMAKRIAKILLSPRVSKETIDAIVREIDAAITMNNDSMSIQTDVEIGLVSLDTASQIRGYVKGEVEKAAKDHADRLSRIAIAQTPGGGAARGLPDLTTTPSQDGSAEKKQSRQTTTDSSVTDKTRGLGK